ncbi:MAG: hypothetical protein ACUVV5_03880 [Candidatus Aminicenantales bacterium]
MKFHLFDRAFSRSRKVLAAMLLRGFDGRVQTFRDFRLKVTDFLLPALVILLTVMTLVLS